MLNHSTQLYEFLWLEVVAIGHCLDFLTFLYFSISTALQGKVDLDFKIQFQVGNT